MGGNPTAQGEDWRAEGESRRAATGHLPALWRVHLRRRGARGMTTTEHRREYVLSRSPERRMTADEMLTDAHDRILAATAKAAQDRLEEVTRIVNVLLKAAADGV